MNRCKDCIYSDKSKTRPGASRLIYCSKLTEKNNCFGQLSDKTRGELIDLHSKSLLIVYGAEVYVHLYAFCSLLKVSCSAAIEHITGIKIDTNNSNCDCGMNYTQFASVISSHSTWCKIHKK